MAGKIELFQFFIFDTISDAPIPDHDKENNNEDSDQGDNKKILCYIFQAELDGFFFGA